MVTVAVAALIGCSSTLAATTGRPPAPSYLFSIPTSSGSLTGPNNQHLTLRLTGARDYLTRFTDRPLRQAFVVANVDFARRYKTYFASSRPNAALTYTQPGHQIPVSIVLTLGRPRWNAARHTWIFSATRIRKRPVNLPGTTVHIKAPLIPTPHRFTRATLLIDDSSDCVEQTFYPYEDCEDVNLTEAYLAGYNLSEIDFTGASLTESTLANANLTSANLTGASLTESTLANANLTSANLTSADVNRTNLTGADFSDANLTNASLTGEDLTGDNFTGAELPGTDLAGANLTYAALAYDDLIGANFTDAVLYNADLYDADLQDANFTNANLTYADITGADIAGADFCNATLPNGIIGGGC